ncbi:MAG: DUF4091 domain-containing protein [Phycisphaerae bacterium]|nr:DUF4091 domain-containing protein [Phycisphaerae bacterium]
MSRIVCTWIALLSAAPSASLLAADAHKNDQGVDWIDWTDNWGVPFGDAATMFYANVENHRKWLADQGVPADKMQFVVGAETSLRKVFRPKWWFHGDMTGQVHLAAARGETESFQLVVCPIADGERTMTRLSTDKDHAAGPFLPKTVKIASIVPTNLKGPDGATIPASALTMARVDYIKTIPAQYPVMNVGDWPDPLMPLEAFDVANPSCQPVWVDLRVPRDANPGRYTGQINVAGPHPVAITVNLTVWPFELPAKRSYVTMGWAFNDWFLAGGVEPLLQKLTVLIDHGLAPWHVCVKLAKNLDDHDRVFRWLQDRGVKLQAMTTSAPDPKYIEHLRRRGWLKHFICIPGDEPHERDWPEYRKRAETIRKQFPGLTVAMTEGPTPANAGMFDLWIIEPSLQRDDFMRAAQARGDRIWWYMCQLPIHDTYPGPIWACPGVVLDRPAVDHRIPYWLAWKYGIEGIGYWAISSWPKGWENWPDQPWPVNPISKYPYSGQHNGNGFLCYPCKGTVLPSLRLKILRDGMDDYEYLLLLKARAGNNPTPRDKQLLAVPPEVAMNLRYYNKDPNAILSARQEIATRIANLPSGP